MRVLLGQEGSKDVRRYNEVWPPMPCRGQTHSSARPFWTSFSDRLPCHQVEMLNLVAQATLNSIIKRSQVRSRGLARSRPRYAVDRGMRSTLHDMPFSGKDI